MRSEKVTGVVGVVLLMIGLGLYLLSSYTGVTRALKGWDVVVTMVAVGGAIYCLADRQKLRSIRFSRRARALMLILGCLLLAMAGLSFIFHATAGTVILLLVAVPCFVGATRKDEGKDSGTNAKGDS